MATLSALALVAACSRADEPAHAGMPVPSASSAASQPAKVITDIAHWQHPAKAVFAKYKVTLKSVTVVGRHATFEVAFPSIPRPSPTPPGCRRCASNC